MILTQPVWWKRVKGKLQTASLVEANDVGAQAEVEAEVSERTVVMCRIRVCGGGGGGSGDIG